MSQIITVTMNPAVDKSAHIEHVTTDVKLRTSRVRRDPGGGGINVSRAVQHLGGASCAVFTAGGIEGRLLQELLGQEGLRQVAVEIAQPVRENLTVVEDSSGSQYRFGMPGPHLSTTEIERVEERVREELADGCYLVASGSLPPGVPADFYARLAGAARDAGARFVLDTSGEPLTHAVEEGVFLVKPNLKELASLLDDGGLEEPRIREAAGELVARGRAEHVLVSMGSGGAYLVNAEGSRKVAAPTVSVRSRIGAGDSMVGGLVFALAEGRAMGEAVRWAVAAGAAAVTTPGTELCHRADTLRLLEEVE